MNTDEYEGHTPGPCLVCGEIDDDDDSCECWICSRCSDRVHDEAITFLDEAPHCGSCFDKAALDLLAEVKRLREELMRMVVKQFPTDKQMEYIEWLEEFAPKAGEYNLPWDAYELAKGIHWTQMEEEE